jgi:hypothetical protein
MPASAVLRFARTNSVLEKQLSAFQVLWTELNRNLCQTRHLAESRMFRV